MPAFAVGSGLGCAGTGPFDRRSLSGAVALALLGHAAIIAALWQPRAPRLGETRVAPVLMRWADAPPGPQPTAAPQPQGRADAPPEPARTRRPRAHRTTAKPAPAQPARAETVAESAPALADEQDPLRMLAIDAGTFRMLDQLSRVVASDPQSHGPGSAVSFELEGDAGGRVWRYVVVGEESMPSASGAQVPVLHLVHFPERDGDERIEVWLLPGLAYRPVQLVSGPDAATSRGTSASFVLDRLAPGAAPAPAPASP